MDNCYEPIHCGRCGTRLESDKTFGRHCPKCEAITNDMRRERRVSDLRSYANNLNASGDRESTMKMRDDLNADDWNFVAAELRKTEWRVCDYCYDDYDNGPLKVSDQYCWKCGSKTIVMNGYERLKRCYKR